MTRRQGRSTDIAQALGGLFSRLDRKSAGAGSAARVDLLWEEVAGPLVSAHTTGVHLRDGVMVVYVDSHARANDLSALSERYRSEINTRLGKELVKKVAFNVSRKVADERRLHAEERVTEEFYREDDVAPVALTSTERAQVEASAAGIPDEKLREAVIRATITDLEWKKGIAERNSREEPRDSV